MQHKRLVQALLLALVLVGCPSVLQASSVGDVHSDVDTASGKAFLGAEQHVLLVGNSALDGAHSRGLQDSQVRDCAFIHGISY